MRREGGLAGRAEGRRRPARLGGEIVETGEGEARRKVAGKWAWSPQLLGAQLRGSWRAARSTAETCSSSLVLACSATGSERSKTLRRRLRGTRGLALVYGTCLLPAGHERPQAPPAARRRCLAPDSVRQGAEEEAAAARAPLVANASPDVATLSLGPQAATPAAAGRFVRIVGLVIFGAQYGVSFDVGELDSGPRFGRASCG